MAWALLLTLLLAGGVKGAHIHAHAASAIASGATEASHCADDCAVCHFLLSPFVVCAAPRLVAAPAATPVFFDSGAVRVASAALPPPTSRGPPAASRI